MESAWAQQVPQLLSAKVAHLDIAIPTATKRRNTSEQVSDFLKVHLLTGTSKYQMRRHHCLRTCEWLLLSDLIARRKHWNWKAPHSALNRSSALACEPAEFAADGWPIMLLIPVEIECDLAMVSVKARSEPPLQAESR